MSDDTNTHEIYVTPDHIEVGNAYGLVAIRLRTSSMPDTFLPMDVISRFEPVEADRLADVLRRQAALVRSSRSRN